MSVLIVTSLGDIVVDLFVEKCPLTTKNFLKLCKIKYYNGCLFHTVQKDFAAQTGDPSGTGTGGDSVYKFIYGDQARFFSDEVRVDLKHEKTGTVAMASAGENLNASQFYITLRDDLEYLDGKHTIFGEVAEGFDTLTRINEAYVDEKNRPYKNIRIKHTYILEDPFDDPSQLAELIPDSSPEGKPKDEVDDEVRLEDDWVPLDEQLNPAELEEVVRSKDAHSSAVVLESIGDIPDADIKPPDNVLFVCKLNPVTEDEDLHTIFSRFGTVVSAEIIRDYKTGASLCYAFIEFEKQEACEQAYFKMDNALIDDRRIHVDFSQSVAKLWNQYRRRGNQDGKVKGCFKCGVSDHIAKDCTGQQPAKYVFRDDTRQHGGYSDSRYEMLFDEDTPENPRRERKHRGHDPDDRVDKTKLNSRNSDLKDRDQEKRDPSYRHREGDRKRENRENWMGQDSRASQHGGSRIDRGYPEDRRDREMRLQRQEGGEGEGRYKSDYMRNSDTSRSRDRRDEGDYRKRSAENDRAVRRENGDHGKRSSEDDSRQERRDDGDHRKRSADGDARNDRRKDDRDYRKTSSHSDRRDARKELNYRKGSEDDENNYKRRRDKRDTDGDRDRKLHGDRRK